MSCLWLGRSSVYSLLPATSFTMPWLEPFWSLLHLWPHTQMFSFFQTRVCFPPWLKTSMCAFYLPCYMLFFKFRQWLWKAGGALAHEHNEVNRNSGLCIVLLHSSFKLWFLIISLRSLIAFQAVHFLGNSDLQVLELVFLGSKLHFYKAVKSHLHHKQHEPHMLFWQAGLLLQCNTDHCEVSLSLYCPIMHRYTTTAFKSKLWCSLPGDSRVFCAHKKQEVLCRPLTQPFQTGSKLVLWNPFTSFSNVQH